MMAVAPTFFGPSPDDWLVGRRYGVPMCMVEEATRRRMAGDWRGACAAAWIDAQIDFDRVNRRDGVHAVAQLTEDLGHLVPDLLRWHLHDGGPDTYSYQSPPGRGLLRPGRRVVLARYGQIALVATTPVRSDRPQRIGLVCSRAKPDAEDWTWARYLWDARQTPDLLHRMGGGDRTPFFWRDGRPRTPAELAVAADDPVARTERVLPLQDAGLVHEAWRAAGVDADGLPLANPPWPAGYAAMVPVMAPAVKDRLAASDAPDVMLLSGVAVRLIDGVLRASGWQPGTSARTETPPRILWCRMPDLELLRAGRITAPELHPLVRAALFPEQPDPGYQPRPRPPDTDVCTVECDDIEVTCTGRAHRIGFRAGRITALDHTPQEITRERTLGVLGGPAAPCVSVLDAWSRAPRRVFGLPPQDDLPPALARLRAHAVLALYHGDTDEIVRLLEAGIDPHGMRDIAGGPLHRLARVDGLRLLPRLLAAGLDINEVPEWGYRPLRSALAEQADDDVILAMLAAGAEFGPQRPRREYRTRLEAIASGNGLTSGSASVAGTGSPDLAPPGSLAGGATPT
jgi:hypothetical protein